MNDKLNPQWVRGSIFYDREQWGKLLGEAIFPFIDSEKELINTYYVHLEVSPRDHIKLTMKSTEPGNTELESRFLDYMDQYLLDNPSEAVHTQHNFYPNNTAWVNQYNESDFYLADDERGFDYIREKIADALRQLAVDTIDTSSMYTFIFYLQLGLLKANYTDVNQLKAEIDLITTSLKAQYKDPSKFINATTNKVGKQFFTSNKEILIEIIDDIWGELHYNPDLQWLGEWIEACKYFIKDANFTASFILISRLVYDSLGLMNNKLLPLSLQIITSAFNEKAKYQISIKH
ncbi:MAG: hypothetical protein EOP46_07635 [Sphingobacteriaceae bacterium]|nr:MAG: hypothetical protein EOP46_07635 [Sphingobacteriaceae bacterium]